MITEKNFEKKTKLLEAALNEFSSKKFADASLNNILKDAGISKGTFYYHFTDKQELYIYLLKYAAEAKWNFINNNINTSSLLESTDVFDLFKIQARVAAEFASIHPKYHKLNKMFVKEKGQEIYNVAKNILIVGNVNPLNEIIENAIEKGNFRNEFSKEFIIKIINYCFFHFEDIFCSEEDMELDNMLRNLDCYIDFIKNGLSK